MNYQERAIDEYNELTARMQKLREFIKRVEDGVVDMDEVKDFNLLKAQLSAMETYQTILYERIANF